MKYAAAMRSAHVAVTFALLATAGCKRDDAQPPTPVVIDASTVTDSLPIASASPSTTVGAMPSASTSAAADAGPVDAGAADAGVDTSKWETHDINTLGTAHFAFEGTVMFPKGTKTKASGSHVAGGSESGGTFAFLDLPDHTQVMLNERSAMSVKDGTFEKQIIGQTTGGKLIFDRADANGYFYAFQAPSGILVQGASWTVSPGLGCATSDPITQDKLLEVNAICASLRPKKK